MENQEYFIVKNSERNLSSPVLNELESWTYDDWFRRTGFFAMPDKSDNYSRFRIQLRTGIIPNSKLVHLPSKHSLTEVEYYDFLRETGLFWTEKPVWDLQFSRSPAKLAPHKLGTDRQNSVRFATTLLPSA